jgi:hypothetical protein
MMVDLPTPVSPMTTTAWLVYLSIGIAWSPLWMSSLSLSRLIGLD